MRRCGIVFERELKQTVRSRPFLVISIVFAVVLAAIAVVAAVLTFAPVESDGTLDLTAGNNSNEWDYAVAVYDHTRHGDMAELLEEQLTTYRFDLMTSCDDELIARCLDDEYDAFIIINGPLDFECCEETTIYGSSVADAVAAALERSYRTQELKKYGVSQSDAAAVLDVSASYVLRQTNGYGAGNYIVSYILTMVMYLVISLYGQMVATRVATEKNSRTMEVLATTVTPGELLCGKVLGVGAAGFAQLMVFIGAACGILMPALAKIPQIRALLFGMFDFSPASLIVLAAYFVLGFLLVAFIYGGLGSTVSRVEDLSGIVSLPSYLFMVGYFISLFGAAGQPGVLMRIASFIPFWSPVVMISRMLMEQVPTWQVAASLTLLAASCVLAAELSVRIYRTGMLRYGKPPKIRELASLIRSAGRRADLKK